ncbi:MAG: type 4a pilus biogenesis protein PilO [Planctomycetota bacterium]
MKASDKKKIVGIASISLLLAGGFGYLTYDAHQETQTAESETDSLRQQVATARKKKEGIPELEKQVIILRENLKEYVKILPENDEVTQYITTINDFAVNAGVAVDLLRPIKAKGAGVFERIVYQLQLNGNTAEILRFLSAIENHRRFIRVSKFDVLSGKRERRGASGQEEIDHAVTMELETYVYNPGKSKQPIATIEDYERKRDELRAQIITARNDIQVERYALELDLSRRDPFLDPRLTDEELGQQQADYQRQQEVVTWAQESIALLVSKLEEHDQIDNLILKYEYRKQIDALIADFNKDLNRALRENWVTFPDLKRQIQSEVVKPFETLKDQWGGEEFVPQRVDLAELEGVMRRMTRALEQGDHASATAEYGLISAKLEAARADDRATRLVDRIERLLKIAEVTAEFAGLSLDVSGRILRPDTAVVILNGKALAPGEPVPGLEGLYVTSIAKDRVEFLFKDILISKTF